MDKVKFFTRNRYRESGNIWESKSLRKQHLSHSGEWPIPFLCYNFSNNCKIADSALLSNLQVSNVTVQIPVRAINFFLFTFFLLFWLFFVKFYFKVLYLYCFKSVINIQSFFYRCVLLTNDLNEQYAKYKCLYSPGFEP